MLDFFQVIQPCARGLRVASGGIQRWSLLTPLVPGSSPGRPTKQEPRFDEVLFVSHLGFAAFGSAS